MSTNKPSCACCRPTCPFCGASEAEQERSAIVQLLRGMAELYQIQVSPEIGQVLRAAATSVHKGDHWKVRGMADPLCKLEGDPS